MITVLEATGTIKKRCLYRTVMWFTEGTRTRITTTISIREKLSTLIELMVCFSFDAMEMLPMIKTITTKIKVKNHLFTTTIRHHLEFRIETVLFYKNNRKNGQSSTNKCVVCDKNLPV